MSIGRSIFQLSFEISPIVLTGGVATNILGGMLPIVAITEAPSFVTGLLSGGTEASLDEFFAHFRPLPGGSIASYQIGKYPFANQSVAANAIIQQPLRLSMRMDCPAKDDGGYITKLATMSALQVVVQQHATMGGLYTIATPSIIYPNGILLDLTDISSSEDKQAQTVWRWDFEFPLITLAQAAQAQNQLMSAVSNGLPTDGSTSGPNSTIGFQNSLATSAVVPSASGLPGAVSGQPALGAGS